MTWQEFRTFFTQPLFEVGNTWVTPATLVHLVIAIIMAVVLSRLVRRILRTRVLPRTKLEAGIQYAIARIVGYVVLAFGLIIGLSTIGIDLSSLTVVAGALGVGIGFGLQNIIHNFVSGLIILAERSIEIGDRVEVGGTAGRVVRIGARATSVLTNDNINIIVPNSEFVSGRFINWTAGGDRRVRFKIPVGVGYKSDVRLVEKLLLDVAAGNAHVLKDPAPQVAFLEFGESSLNFELRVWTVTMSEIPGTLRSALNFAIWDKFKQHGIELPFPQRDLHVKEPVKVELAGKRPM